MLPGSAHLLLDSSEETLHGSLRIEFGIDRDGLDEHADGVCETLVVAAGEHGVEKRLVSAAVAGEKESVCSGVEGAFEKACLLAECAHLVRRHFEDAAEAAVLYLSVLKIGSDLRECVGAVVGRGEPGLVLRIGRSGAEGGFLLGKLCEGELLSGEGLPVVGLLDIVKEQLGGGPVVYDVVDVDEKAEVGGVLDYADAEEPVREYVEGFDEVFFDRVDAFYTLDLKVQIFFLNGLDRFAVSSLGNPREEDRVGFHGRFHGLAETVPVEGTVENIQKRKVIENLAGTSEAGHVEAILGPA